MPYPAKQLLADLESTFSNVLQKAVLEYAEVTIEISAESVSAVCTRLRDEFGFAQLIDACGVDYLHYGSGDWQTEASGSGFSRGVETGVQRQEGETSARFAVVYHLLSVERNQRLRVRAFLSAEPPRVESVTPIWSSALWFEREAFDMYGILFEGHPDLRRILTDYGFVGHPLRKDFPVSGYVEMRYDPEKQRVIYEPVSIEPRVLVPKVIREDNRYTQEAQQDA